MKVNHLHIQDTKIINKKRKIFKKSIRIQILLQAKPHKNNNIQNSMKYKALLRLLPLSLRLNQLFPICYILKKDKPKLKFKKFKILINYQKHYLWIKNKLLIQILLQDNKSVDLEVHKEQIVKTLNKKKLVKKD